MTEHAPAQLSALLRKVVIQGGFMTLEDLNAAYRLLDLSKGRKLSGQPEAT